MSSSEDSETAEWEREQMLRGSQSRGRQQTSSRQQTTTDKDGGGQTSTSVIDATEAKRHVKCDIDRIENEIETIKKHIGSTRLEIARSEKRIDAMKKYIQQLESSNPFFEEITSLKQPEDIIQCLEKNRLLIEKLPPDQKEMIDLLEGNMRETQTSVMDVDD